MMALSSASILARLGILRPVAAAMLLLVTAVLASADAEAGKRVAMVIGNSAYQHAPELANPANDAADIAAELRSLGFTVVEGIDLTSRGMRDKIREFANELRGAEVGMLFYAGHGLQVNGRNYLAPVDAKLEFESDLDFETIPLEFVQRQMEREVETVLLFLDACRDNPLTRSFRTASRSNGVGKGLAELKSAAGTLIAFATDPNNVALDGNGRNSPFTKALLANIDRQDVEIQTMMTDVRQQVHKETNQQQTPWINSSLLGRFYFSAGSQVAGEREKVAAATPDTAGAGRQNSSALSSAQIEALAWDTVKDTKNPEELEAFLSEYGSGFYGKLARLRLQRLKEREDASGEDAETQTAGATAPQDEASDRTQIASLEQPQAEGTRRIEAQGEVDPREVARGIQQELDRLGCRPGRPDGIWGRRSQGALDRFARHAKVKLASANPDTDLLDQLENYDGEGCPVVKTCPAGQRLSSKGNCFTPRQQARSAAPAEQPGATQQQVIVHQQPGVAQQPGVIQQQPVIVQQPGVVQQQPVIVQQQPVIVQQPQPRNPLSGLIGGAVGAGVCILTGC